MLAVEYACGVRGKRRAYGGSTRLVLCVELTPTRRQIGELRVPLQEAELDGAGRAVAVLGEDQLGDALRLGLLAL